MRDRFTDLGDGVLQYLSHQRHHRPVVSQPRQGPVRSPRGRWRFRVVQLPEEGRNRLSARFRRRLRARSAAAVRTAVSASPSARDSAGSARGSGRAPATAHASWRSAGAGPASHERTANVASGTRRRMADSAAVTRTSVSSSSSARRTRGVARSTPRVPSSRAAARLVSGSGEESLRSIRSGTSGQTSASARRVSPVVRPSVARVTEAVTPSAKARATGACGSGARGAHVGRYHAPLRPARSGASRTSARRERRRGEEGPRPGARERNGRDAPRSRPWASETGARPHRTRRRTTHAWPRPAPSSAPGPGASRPIRRHPPRTRSRGACSSRSPPAGARCSPRRGGPAATCREWCPRGKCASPSRCTGEAAFVRSICATSSEMSSPSAPGAAGSEGWARRERRKPRRASADELELRGFEAWVAHEPTKEPVPERAVPATRGARRRAARTSASRAHRFRARSSARPLLSPIASTGIGAPPLVVRVGCVHSTTPLVERPRARWSPPSAEDRPPRSRGAAEGEEPRAPVRSIWARRGSRPRPWLSVRAV